MGTTTIERRVQILRDWHANKLSYRDALRMLVQEGGMSVNAAANELARA